MKKFAAVVILLIIVFGIFLTAGSSNRIPKGWFPAGNKVSEYEAGVDNEIFKSGNSSAYLKSKSPGKQDFGNLMQVIDAENYLGKRLRFSGYLKTEDVKGWSGLWMRIDGEDNKQLGFDNMQNRPVKGSNDWSKYEIVLDVPEGSRSINYGVLLGGNGKVWADDLKIEEVDKSVKVTNLLQKNDLPREPVNLDFEE